MHGRRRLCRPVTPPPPVRDNYSPNLMEDTHASHETVSSTPPEVAPDFFDLPGPDPAPDPKGTPPPTSPDPDDIVRSASAAALVRDEVFGVMLAPGAHRESPDQIRRLTRLFRRTYSLLYPDKRIDYANTRALVTEAFQSADDEFGEGERT